MNYFETGLRWADQNRFKALSIAIFLFGVVIDIRIAIVGAVLFIATSEKRRNTVVALAKEYPVVTALTATIVLYAFVQNGWILVAGAIGCLVYLMHKNSLWKPTGELSKKFGGLVLKHTPDGVKVFIFGLFLCVLAVGFKSYGYTGAALILGFLGAAICWGAVSKGFDKIGRFFSPIVSPLVDHFGEKLKTKKSAEEKKAEILEKIEKMKVKAAKEKEEADWRFLCKIEAMVDKGIMTAEAANVAIKKHFGGGSQQKKKKED